MRYTRETKVGVFVLAAFVLFIFIGFQLGTFCLSRHTHASYILHFKDISGLLKKAEVKIAGVKVGWVEDIVLIEDDCMYARVDLLIDKSCYVYQDAYGLVRQEGILGPAYLELVPGTPTAGMLNHGAHLTQPHVAPTSLDELLRAFSAIAHDVQTITQSCKQVITDGSVTQQMDELIVDVKQVVKQLKDGVLPTMQESMTKIANVCDRDFSQFADRVASTADMMQDASQQLSVGFQTFNEITSDMQEGRGCVGQLLTDDQVYHNLSYATGKIKEGFRWFDNLSFVFDGQVENMFECAEHACFKDSKGIFNVRIYTEDDYFYVVGVTTSQKGYISRYATFRDYTDNCMNEICPDACDLPDWAKYQYLFNTNVQRVKRNAFKVDLQIGKVYKIFSLRAGLFEGTGGVAADIFIPYKGRYGIISTLQLYDFHGQNRIDDDRPHMKWLTRFFLFDHVYVAFGFDDFISRCNSSFFLGAGFRFGDDEMQWYRPRHYDIA